MQNRYVSGRKSVEFYHLGSTIAVIYPINGEKRIITRSPLGHTVVTPFLQEKMIPLTPEEMAVVRGQIRSGRGDIGEWLALQATTNPTIRSFLADTAEGR